MSLLLLFAGAGTSGGVVIGTVSVDDEELSTLTVTDSEGSAVSVSDSELMPEFEVEVWDMEL